MKGPCVYLAGPIFGKNDDECRGWRERAKHLLGGYFRALDPMRRDYRGSEQLHSKDIVKQDIADIAESDAVLAFVAAPSWGTAMEIARARVLDKFIVGWGAEGNVSPWLVEHCDAVFRTLEDACDEIVFWERET